jgi:hypothetical protein
VLGQDIVSASLDCTLKKSEAETLVLLEQKLIDQLLAL